MSKPRIELVEWHYTCGDGCCDDYGTELLIDGKRILRRCEFQKDELEALLDALNVEYEEIEHGYEY